MKALGVKISYVSPHSPMLQVVEKIFMLIKQGEITKSGKGSSHE